MDETRDRFINSLFLENVRSLKTYLVRLVSRTDVAEDLAQDAFLRLRSSGHTELDSPRAFLFRTAQNLARDYGRRAALVPMDPLDERPDNRFADQNANPEEVLASRQELARVRAVLIELPPRCRHVFLLVRVEGLSQRAVAAQMEISQTMVRKYLSRAVQHLAEKLGSDGR